MRTRSTSGPSAGSCLLAPRPTGSDWCPSGRSCRIGSYTTAMVHARRHAPRGCAQSASGGATAVHEDPRILNLTLTRLQGDPRSAASRGRRGYSEISTRARELELCMRMQISSSRYRSSRRPDLDLDIELMIMSTRHEHGRPWPRAPAACIFRTPHACAVRTCTLTLTFMYTCARVREASAR